MPGAKLKYESRWVCGGLKLNSLLFKSKEIKLLLSYKIEEQRLETKANVNWIRIVESQCFLLLI